MTTKRKTKVQGKRRFNMEVAAAELSAFKEAALKKGMSMSAWARLALRAASGL